MSLTEFDITPEEARAELIRRGTIEPGPGDFDPVQSLQTGLQKSFAGTGDVEPTGNILQDVGTAVSNIPSSAANVVGGVASLLTPSGLSGVAKTVGSSVGGFFDIIGGETQTREAKIAQEVWHELTRVVREPGKTFINDPVGAALDVAGVLAGGASLAGVAARVGGKSTRIASALSKASEAANPINWVVKVARTAAKPLNLESAAGVATGAGRGAFAIARQAGKKGGLSEKAFRAAREGEILLEDVAGKVRSAVDDLKGIRGQEFRADLDGLSQSRAINPDAVRAEIFTNLEKNWNIKIKAAKFDPTSGEIKLGIDWPHQLTGRSASGQRAKVEDMVEALVDWERADDFKVAWDIEQRLDGIIDRSPLTMASSTRANAILTQTRQIINKELRASVNGFEPLQTKYRAATEQIDQISKVLSVRNGFITETELTKLGNLLNTRTSGNLELRRKALTDLDKVIFEKTGQQSNLFEELAGIRLQSPETLGIARAQSRSSSVATGLGAAGGFAVGGPVGAAIGGVAMKGMSQLLMNASIRNPRVVGSFFLNLGVAERKAKLLVDAFTKVKAAMPENAITSGMAFGVALRRMSSTERMSVMASLSDAGFNIDSSLRVGADIFSDLGII